MASRNYSRHYRPGRKTITESGIIMDKKKLLVVDDDTAWLRMIERVLKENYDLELATGFADAISLAKTSLFSLAILDQRIEGNTSGGIELLSCLREIQPGLRGIILTGYADLDDAVTSMRSAFDYISKGRGDLEDALRKRVENAIVHDPHNDPIPALIQRGESAELEFKSSVRWDFRQSRANQDLEFVIVKTVAGFLNSELGGVLLIGVDDAGNVIGLQNDYKTLKRQDRDGFENFLITLLLDTCGKDMSMFIRVDFHDFQGNEVCRVSTKPAPRAVFLKNGEQLFIRAGNSTRQLSTREAIDYCKMRWK